MNNVRDYQMNIALESTLVLARIMGVHRKRKVIVTRWKKLYKYLKRSIHGKSGGAA